MGVAARDRRGGIITEFRPRIGILRPAPSFIALLLSLLGLEMLLSFEICLVPTSPTQGKGTESYSRGRMVTLEFFVSDRRQALRCVVLSTMLNLFRRRLATWLLASEVALLN